MRSIIPTSGCVPEGIISRNFNMYLYIHVHSSIIHNSQKVKTLKFSSMDE